MRGDELNVLACLRAFRAHCAALYGQPAVQGDEDIHDQVAPTTHDVTTMGKVFFEPCKNTFCVKYTDGAGHKRRFSKGLQVPTRGIDNEPLSAESYAYHTSRLFTAASRTWNSMDKSDTHRLEIPSTTDGVQPSV